MSSLNVGRRTLAASLLALSLVGLAGCGSSQTAATPNANDLVATAVQAETKTPPDPASLDQARNLLVQAIQIDPHNEAAYFNLGYVSQLQSKANEAIGYYRTALIINPNDIKALYNLGTAVAATAPYEAMELYFHVLALDPQNAAAYLNLGFAMKAVGQTAQGELYIAKAVQLDPTLGHPTSGSTPSASATPKA